MAGAADRAASGVRGRGEVRRLLKVRALRPQHLCHRVRLWPRSRGWAVGGFDEKMFFYQSTVMKELRKLPYLTTLDARAIRMTGGPSAGNIFSGQEIPETIQRDGRLSVYLNFSSKKIFYLKRLKEAAEKRQSRD